MKKYYFSSLIIFLSLFSYSQSTTLVISQVYGGGGNSGATYTHDFIEVFNKGNSAIDINGYAVQYAAATGTSWAVTTLKNTSFLLQPGQYFLVQLASSGANGIALPTPDVTNLGSNMSATAGKVSLTNNNTALTGSCPISASIIDKVGYGSTATCFETTTAPAPSNITSINRKLNGCQDTDDNSVDFGTTTPSPRNTSSPFNICSGCTTPTQGASLLRYKSSPTATSMELLFTRGNGSGAIVLCRQAGLVNATPVSGTTYTANATFGSGSVLNTDNYVVHATTWNGVVGFSVNGLTANTKYYFSVFEYNDPGKCYATTGLVDSFTVGATIFKPGDMVIIGWDNNAFTGDDKLYLMNMVPITKGTKFSLVNSRFEAGAAANTRTNKWYGGSDDPYQNPDKHDWEYTGAGIASGSVISCQSNGLSGFTSFSINGGSVSAATFSAKSGTSNFLSSTDGDQLYIVQGVFTPYGTTGSSRYNLLDGLVIHGITTNVGWIPLNTSVSAATTGGATRQSRIPPDILCINTEFSNGSNGVAYYNTSTGTMGTKATMLGRLKNIANWTYSAGTTTNDIPAALGTTTYTINSPKPDGDWNGTVSNDWFDCNNWEGLHVPDSTLSINVYGLPTAVNNCSIDVSSSSKAAEYINVAKAGTINVLPVGSLSLFGVGSEKLTIEDSLVIDLGGSLNFENNSNANTDSIQLHGSFSDYEPTNILLGFQAGQGVIDLQAARFSNNTNRIFKQILGTSNFYKLAMNNSRSTQIVGDVSVANNLNLQNGLLSTLSSSAKLSLLPTATITSPINIYGDVNKGYKASFINGKMYFQTNASNSVVDFPIGKIWGTDTLFAPVKLTKATSNTITYDAEYIAAAYSDLSLDIATLSKVSSLEHWLINADNLNPDAKVTLSWRPQSLVGNGIPANDATALDSLRVAHYFDDDGLGGNPSLWHVDGSDLAIMPKSAGATVNYGLITTNLNTGSFSPFTLGTRGVYNLLPLKLIEFNAIQNKGSVDINWVTTEERLVNYFEVEHSNNGFSFQFLTKQQAQNNFTENKYSTVDNTPFIGWNYYRLKIVDLNGKITYSGISKVWIAKATNVLLYPNPVVNELHIVFSTTDNELHQVEVYNHIGALVTKTYTKQNQLALNVNNLAKGLYYVRMIIKGKVITESFLKQ